MHSLQQLKNIFMIQLNLVGPIERKTIIKTLPSKLLSFITYLRDLGAEQQIHYLNWEIYSLEECFFCLNWRREIGHSRWELNANIFSLYERTSYGVYGTLWHTSSVKALLLLQRECAFWQQWLLWLRREKVLLLDLSYRLLLWTRSHFNVRTFTKLCLIFSRAGH